MDVADALAEGLLEGLVLHLGDEGVDVGGLGVQEEVGRVLGGGEGEQVDGLKL